MTYIQWYWSHFTYIMEGGTEKRGQNTGSLQFICEGPGSTAIDYKK